MVFIAVAFYAVSSTLVFLAGGVWGVSVGLTASEATAVDTYVAPDWEANIDMGTVVPIEATFDIDEVEKEAHAKDVYTSFVAGRELVGKPTAVVVASGDHSALILGKRGEVCDAVAYLFFKVADGNFDQIKEEALIHALDRMGPENAAIFLGLREPTEDYPAAPEAVFNIEYSAKCRGLLAYHYPLM